MRSPARQNNTPDRRFATAAGFSGPQVDAVFELKEAAHAVGIHVVGDRRSAQPDGMMENLAQRNAQPLELGSGEPTGGPPRPEAGMKKALIGIDVAHPGEKCLVQQRGLDCQPAPTKEHRKLFRADGERILAGRPKRGNVLEIAELKPAESPGIDKTQLAATCQAKTCMSMGVHGGVGRRHQQTAAHAKVNDPLCFRLFAAARASIARWRSQLTDDVFSSTVDCQNLSSSQSLGLARRRSFEWLGIAAEPGLHDAVSPQPFVDAARNRLHLGQFRHSLYCMRVTCGSRGRESGSPQN